MGTMRKLNNVIRSNKETFKVIQKQTENTLVTFGDSITALYNVAQHISDRSFLNWINILLGQPFKVIKVSGFSGFRSDQILPLVQTAVLDFNPTTTLVNIGENDINQGKTAAATMSNIVKIYEQLLQANIRVIGTTITASSTGQDTAAKKAEYHKLNRMIKEYGRNNPGVIILDMGAAYIQPDAVAALTDHTVDQTHPSAIGAVKMAKIAVETLKYHFVVPPTTMVYSSTDPTNLLGNGNMSGNTGTISNGSGATATGVVPTGWVLGLYGNTSTATLSKVPKSLNRPGEDLQIEVTASAATTHFTAYREVSSGFSVGDTVYAQCEVEIDTAATFGQSITFGVDQRINGNSTPVTQNYGLFHESAAPNLNFNPGTRLTIRTQDFKVANTVDRLRVIFDAYLLTGKVRLVNFELRKV